MSKLKKDTNEPAYHHGKLKRACMLECLEMLKTHSPSSISLREIARRLKVSHGAPYRHFKNKEELFSELSTESFELFSGFLKKSQKIDKSLVENFFLMGKAYLNFALSHPERYRLMFNQNVLKEKPENLVKSGSEAFMLLLSSVDSLVKNKIFIDKDPQDLSLFIWSQLHGFCSLALDQRIGSSTRGESVTDIFGNTLEILKRALVA